MSLNNPFENFGQKPIARAPLEKIWEFEAGGDILHRAVAYGSVFFGSKDKYVYALDAASGQVKWTFKMNETVHVGTPLVVADGILYVFGENKNLYAIDIQTGEKRWQFATGENIWYPPIVADGIAYVVSKSKKDRILYAINAQTGLECWRFSANEDIGFPEVGCGKIFFGSKDKRIYALDASSGATTWKVESGHKNISRPTEKDGEVLIYGDQDLYAFDATNGTLLWKIKDAITAEYSTGTLFKPKVEENFVICDKELTLVELTSGLEKAKLAPDQSISVDGVKNGIIYARYAAGTLCAIDLATGDLKWYAVIETKWPYTFDYALSEEFVFAIAFSSMKLYGINISRFTKRWELPDLVSLPIIAGEMVFISKGKKMYGYGSAKGSPSQFLLEIGENVAPSPTYIGSVFFTEYTKKFLGATGKICWPECCCLCCGPVEKRVNLMKSMDRVDLFADGIPYCAPCYKKITGIFKKEKPGVEIIRTSPPTFAFRNEKYWAMFMKANRAR